jgi:hypothetical protein
LGTYLQQDPLQWLRKKCEDHDNSVPRLQPLDRSQYDQLSAKKRQYQQQIHTGYSNLYGNVQDGLTSGERAYLAEFVKKEGRHEYLKEHRAKGFSYLVADLDSLDVAYQKLVKHHVLQNGIKRNVIVQICAPPRCSLAAI